MPTAFIFAHIHLGKGSRHDTKQSNQFTREVLGGLVSAAGMYSFAITPISR